MTPVDISKLPTTVIDALRPFIEQQVQNAVREIPYRVREYLDDELHTVVRERIRKAVKEHVNVEVKVNA